MSAIDFRAVRHAYDLFLLNPTPGRSRDAAKFVGPLMRRVIELEEQLSYERAEHQTFAEEALHNSQHVLACTELNRRKS